LHDEAFSRWSMKRGMIRGKVRRKGKRARLTVREGEPWDCAPLL